MAEVPQTDVSRPSALPTAKLLYRGPAQPLVEQNSAEYLDSIEEEWNKKVDMEIETLVDGMVDFVSLASVSGCVGISCHGRFFDRLMPINQIVDKDKFRIAQEAFQAQSRAESMVSISGVLFMGLNAKKNRLT